MPARVIEIELRVRDVDASRRFYADLIGLPCGEPETHRWDSERHVHATWGAWDRQGSQTYFLFSIYSAGAAEATQARLGLVVDDLAAVHARLEQAGVKVIRPPQERPWGMTATYRDPDGNSVSLTERPR